MTGPARIEFSVFRPEYIAQLLLQKWRWKRVTCELWNRGVSDTYRVAHQGKRAYLKIYPSGWRTRAEIQGEVDLLSFLDGRNVRVARPIMNNAGTFVESVSAPEGRRYAVLFAEAKGVMPKFNAENSRKYGLMTGTVHSATDMLSGSLRRPYLGIDQLIHEPLARAHSFLASRPRDLAYLTRLSRDLADAVGNLLPLTRPEFGMCHGDLTFGNVRRNSQGQMTLFDFDCSGYGWRAYDLAVFLQSYGSDFSRNAVAGRMKQWDAFIDGYHDVRRLSGRELEAVKLFVPVRQFWHLGMHASQLVQLGRRSIRDARFDMRLEFIKNWIKACKLL